MRRAEADSGAATVLVSVSMTPEIPKISRPDRRRVRVPAQAAGLDPPLPPGHLRLAMSARQQCWYVNFQHPYLRTPSGFDTLDLLLDLVITPDLSQWRWKDEDTQARRLGVVTDTVHQHVDHARDQALDMIRNRQGPFHPERHQPRWAPPRGPGSRSTRFSLTSIR